MPTDTFITQKIQYHIFAAEAISVYVRYMPYYWSPVCRGKKPPRCPYLKTDCIHDFHFWYYFRYWSMHLIAIYSTCSCNITNGASQQARKEIFLFNKYIMAHYYTLCNSLEKKFKFTEITTKNPNFPLKRLWIVNIGNSQWIGSVQSI